ncbi:MAG TPA: DsbA family protein [Candidatus Nanoarchaeia archaeon]|nr:DsbA family protein [Candidatus Nanoarchaeia archaeon]
MEIKKESRKIVIEELTLWKTATLILGILFIVSIFTNGFSGSTAKQVVVQQDQQVPTQQQLPSQPVDIDITGEPALGDKNAPVTIVEFIDYQCPFCGRAFQQTYPIIKKDYIDTGKVYYVIRDYPLPFHTEADEASASANCANQQGKYWEMHDMLFSNQAQWSGSQNVLTIFNGYAKTLGLNENTFASCTTDKSVLDEISQDTADGSKYGVSGTPTFFINGKALVGAQPLSAFQAAIEAELQ